MIEDAALIVRIMAAATFAAAGVTKLVELRALGATVWTPKPLGPAALNFLTAVVATVEVLTAIILALAVAPAVGGAVAVMLLAIATGYGAARLRRLGACGCGAFEVTTIPLLAGRNFALATAAVLGLALGPNSSNLDAHESAAAIAAVIWLTGLLAARPLIDVVVPRKQTPEPVQQ